MDKHLLLENGFMLTKLNDKKPGGLFLIGEFMHGDADGDSKNEMQLESIDEMKAVIVYLKWIQSLPYNARIDYRLDLHKKGDDFYRLVGEEWREKHLFDGIIDWWDNDMTYSDAYASLEKYRFIFRDEFGEYEVRL